jgi:hypothetical protein
MSAKGSHDPAGQVLESVCAIGVKGAFVALAALRLDPRTELVAITLWDAGVTVAFDKLFQYPE